MLLKCFGLSCVLLESNQEKEGKQKTTTRTTGDLQFKSTCATVNQRFPGARAQTLVSRWS